VKYRARKFTHIREAKIDISIFYRNFTEIFWMCTKYRDLQCLWWQTAME